MARHRDCRRPDAEQSSEMRAGSSWRGRWVGKQKTWGGGHRNQVNQRMMGRWQKDGEKVDFLRALAILSRKVSLSHC